MNQQWLTMLLSKGIELEQSLRQQVQTATDQVKVQVKKKLEERGVRMSATDLAAVTEELFPNATNAALSYALDVMRPFSAGMGLRISRLSDTQVEVILPSRTRNQNENKDLHEGALVTAAIEAAKLLWLRHAPLEGFDMTVTGANCEYIKNQTEECRLRMELSEQTREAVLVSLRQTQMGTSDCEVQAFDEDDQAVAQFRFQLQFKHRPQLA